MIDPDNKAVFAKTLASLDRAIELCRKSAFWGCCAVALTGGMALNAGIGFWVKADWLGGFACLANLGAACFNAWVVRRPLRDLPILRRMRVNMVRAVNAATEAEAEMHNDQVEAGFKALKQRL